MARKRDQEKTMFEKRHRITLFNAKAYDRQVVEGVGEYLQASQLEWDIFIEEDFRARIENIRVAGRRRYCRL
jgi:LacI family transcriptional regulator